MGTWISAPGGVLPERVTVAFDSKQAAGPDAVDISNISDIGIASVKNGVAFDDPAKKAAREAQRATEAVVSEQEDQNRKAILKNLSAVKDAPTQAVLAALIKEVLGDI